MVNVCLVIDNQYQRRKPYLFTAIIIIDEGIFFDREFPLSMITSFSFVSDNSVIDNDYRKPTKCWSFITFIPYQNRLNRVTNSSAIIFLISTIM